MKKAIAVTELMLIIITVVAGIGLIMLTKKSTTAFGCARDVEVCRDSYALYTGLKQRAGLLSVMVPPAVDCVALSPPNCAEKVLKTDDRQETMRIIAENLRWCWYKTLGSKNKMGEDFARLVLAELHWAEVDFCLVCSEFTPKVDIGAKEWQDFLVRRKMPGSDKTYAEFLDVEKQDELKKEWNTGLDYWNFPYVAFSKGIKYYVVSVSAEGAKEGLVGLYISPDIYCGETDLQQVHYQL